MARCFIAGATGYVGGAVVRRLAATPAHRVVAHVRPDSARLDEWRTLFAARGAEVDATPWEVAALAAALDRHATTHVFCLIGTTRQRADRDGVAGDRYQAVDLGLTRLLCEAAVASSAAPRFVYLSSIGADRQARSSYLRARGEAEDVVAASGLSHLIARPSFVTGADREESRPVERLAAAVTDGALAAVGALGARALRDRWGSLTGDELARALIELGVVEGRTGVVDGVALRAVAR